jgi:hypothetical protein
MELYTDIKITGNRVEFILNKRLKETNYFLQDFWYEVEYLNCSLELLDESILNIPLLANCAPVLWAMDMHVQIPVCDKTFYYSLEEIKKVFIEMYKDLKWSGSLHTEKIQDLSQIMPTPNNPGMLYSGGLDSAYTLLNHINEKPSLCTIRGADISLDDESGWNNIKHQTYLVAKQYELAYSYIQSNFYTFINQKKLNSLSETMPGWWGGVQHGLGFGGLFAPVWGGNNFNCLYIASSHSIAFSTPWGSDPKIDNKIAYGGLQVIHDGYELTRHKKVRELAGVVNDQKLVTPILRVCFSNPENSSANCCTCEKCTRTITALYIEGENPSNYGFDIDENDFIENTLRSFKSTRFLFAENTLFHWKDLSDYIKEKEFYLSRNFSFNIIEYLGWVKEFDFNHYKEVSWKKYKRLKAVQSTLAKSKTLYKIGYVVYLYIKNFGIKIKKI